MLAFAIPIAGVVIHDFLREEGGMWKKWRAWLEMVGAIAVCVAVLAILPLWNARTTGNWKVLATQEYARDYLPFDKLGFTPDSSPPRRALSPVVKSVYDENLALHETQRLRNLPRTLGERVLLLAIDLWDGTQLILLPFAIAGFFFVPRAFRVAVASAGLLFVFYLPYASDAEWTLYYLEIAPVIAAITAVGLWRALARFAPGVGTLDTSRRPKLGSALVALVLGVFALPAVSHWRGQHLEMSSVRMAFAEALTQLPARKTIVFVRYAPRTHHLSLVFNFADPNRASAWVVHDRGAQNKQLMNHAQDRTAYVFDEATGELRRF
jgi:hypothetical protein